MNNYSYHGGLNNLYSNILNADPILKTNQRDERYGSAKLQSSSTTFMLYLAKRGAQTLKKNESFACF
jgi:hypothetical protein